MADGSAPLLSGTDDITASYLDHRNRILREAQAERVLLRQAAASAPRPNAMQPTGTIVPFGRWGRAPGTRSAALDDIGAGIEEAPLQAFAGISDTIGNTLIAADELAGWLNTHVADLRFSTLFGMEGTDAADKNSPEFRQFTEGFKALPQPKSVTGGLVRGSAAWLAGLSASARGLQALGAGATASTIAGGGISSFFTQAAEDPGLSNLVQQYPVLANPVTEFLASKPGDNAALNRLRHSLEGLGLGALAEGFARGLVLVQMARAAKGVGEGTAATHMTAEPASPTATRADARAQPAIRTEATLAVNDSSPSAVDSSLLAPGDPSAALVSAKRTGQAPDMPRANTGTLAIDERGSSAVKSQLQEDFANATQGPLPAGPTTKLGPLTPEGQAHLNTLLKDAGIELDLSEYDHVVTKDAARHAFKNHGDAALEADRGQLPVTANDWASIPEILSSPDGIELSPRSSRSGRIVFIYTKQMDGYVTYLEEVRTGKRALASVTMWKKPGQLKDLVGSTQQWPISTRSRRRK